jgi:hypothetical protein
MTPAQCRAARALADISQAQLSGIAVVPCEVIEEFAVSLAPSKRGWAMIIESSHYSHGFCLNCCKIRPVRFCGIVTGNVFILDITCLEVEVETSDSNILGRRSRLLNRPLPA